MDGRLWYERLNLVHKCKRFCQKCAGSFLFWLAVAFFTLVEPVLCSYMPTRNMVLAQITVLGVSSILYAIQLIGVATREWEKIVLIQAMSSSVTIAKAHKFTPVKLLVFFTAEGEYILEFCCLLGGWVAIFISPGLATLRCFRVFRLLWFCDLAVFRGPVEDFFSPLLGADFVARGFKVMKFAIKALSALGNEMFRLTSATRGGLLLMLMFFYSAFILGTATFIETGGQFEKCTTRAQCVYILMRLTFYDGDGFDFIFGLTDKHRFLFLITILYLCITGFGIMNGLVGIFGTAFSGASDDAFADKGEDCTVDHNHNDHGHGGDNDGDEPQEYGGQKQARTRDLASKVFRSFRGDLSSDEDSGGEQEGGEQAQGLNPSEMTAENRENNRENSDDQIKGQVKDGNVPDLGSWSSDEERAGGPGLAVWPHEIVEGNTQSTKGPPLARQASTKMQRHDALQEQIDTLTPSDKLEMRRQLAGKLGAKSGFALAELKRIAVADAASPPAPLLRKGHSAKASALTSKPTEFLRTGTGGRVLPMQRYAAMPAEEGGQNHSPSDIEEEQQHHEEHHTHQHQHGWARAGGMFKRQTSNKGIAASDGHTDHLNYVKTNPFAASIQSKTTGVGATGQAQQALEIRSLTLNVQALTRKVEAQTELIAAMFRHMQSMAPGGVAAGALEAPAAVGGNTQHGIVHTLHAVQHAVQDSLGHVLHLHAHEQKQPPSAGSRQSVTPEPSEGVAGVASTGAARAPSGSRTLSPLDTSVSSPSAMSADKPSQQTPHTAAPSVAPTPSAQAGSGAQPDLPDGTSPPS